MRVLCAVAALCVVAAAAAPELKKQVIIEDPPKPPDFLPFSTTIRTPVHDASCQRRSLNVSLADSWDGEVIVPKIYDAGYCAGTCPSSNLRTPYAAVLSRAHLANLIEAPKPCCVATEYDAISILYFDEDLNIVYGVVKDMMVKKCGCR